MSQRGSINDKAIWNTFLHDSDITSDFDPIKMRVELASKFASEWKEIADFKTFIDSLDNASYQLTGDINNPIITKYSLSA